jgi:hypothetical protein
MTQDQINEMRETETALLAKFERKAAAIREECPFLSKAQAFERALDALPRAYMKYQAAREWRRYTHER